MELLVLGLVGAVLVLWSRLARVNRAATEFKEQLAQERSALQDAQSQVGRLMNELGVFRTKEAEIGSQTLRTEKLTSVLVRIEEAIKTADSLLEEREFVIYPRRFPTETSEELKARMDAVRERQSEIRRAGQIVIRFGASAQQKLLPEERAKLKNLVRLTRLALEGAADTLLDQIKATNQDRLDTKFRAVVADLNRLLEPWGFEIGKNYQATVREQFELMAEHLQQVEKEREEQRALRDQMREEAAAQREADRAQREAEQAERQAERELIRAKEAAETAKAEERERWLAKVATLEQALSEAHQAKDRAVAMAQLTKAGHVYVISNIGSFGETVFKVGMTRRLEPLDRIAELGDASVPFPFDIHGLIRTDDAPALEGRLHAALEPYRMNLVNERKEFFQVPFETLRKIIESQGVRIKLTAVAEAAEFRQSVAQRKGLRAPEFTTAREIGAEEPA